MSEPRNLIIDTLTCQPQLGGGAIKCWKRGHLEIIFAYCIVWKNKPGKFPKNRTIPKNGRAPRASRAAHAHFWIFPGIFWNFPAGFVFPYNTVVVFEIEIVLWCSLVEPKPVYPGGRRGNNSRPHAKIATAFARHSTRGGASLGICLRWRENCCHGNRLGTQGVGSTTEHHNKFRNTSLSSVDCIPEAGGARKAKVHPTLDHPGRYW